MIYSYYGSRFNLFVDGHVKWVRREVIIKQETATLHSIDLFGH